jgi:anti-sigma-K factor RskA
MINGHPARDEDFDLLALGALEGEEKQALEAHVAWCANCAHKLAEARGRVAMLSLAAPPVVPSAGVRQSLRAQVRGAAEQSAPARAAREPQFAPSTFGRWWSAVLIPAGVVCAVLTILLWRENRDLDRQLAALRASMSQQRHELREANEVADLMTSQSTISVSLAHQPGTPMGSAHVIYNEKMGMLMCDGQIAPAPADDKSYQLWVIPRNGKPISAGVFSATSGQRMRMMAKVPEGIDAKSFAVTLEPAGGMPHPTGPTVLMGSVS